MEVIGQEIYRFRIDSAEIMYGINLDRFVSVLMVLLNLRLKNNVKDG